MAVAEERSTAHRIQWLLFFCLALFTLYASFQLAHVYMEIDQHVTPWCVETLPFARGWFALLVFCIAVKSGLHIMVLLPVLCRRFASSLDAKFLIMCEYFFVQCTMCPMLWLAQEAWLWALCVGGVLGCVGLVWVLQRDRAELLIVEEALPVKGCAIVGVLAVGSVLVVSGIQDMGVSVWYIVPVEVVVVAGIAWCLEGLGVEGCADNRMQGVGKANAEICLLLMMLDMFVFYYVMQNMMQGCLSVQSMLQEVWETLVFVCYCVEYGVVRRKVGVVEGGRYGSCMV